MNTIETLVDGIVEKVLLDNPESKLNINQLDPAIAEIFVAVQQMKSLVQFMGVIAYILHLKNANPVLAREKLKKMIETGVVASYGADERVEVRELEKLILEEKNKLFVNEKSGGFSKAKAEKFFENSRSVVLIVRKGDLDNCESNEGCQVLRSCILKDRSFYNTKAKLTDTPYLEQRAAYSLGTGFFIDKEVIATAAHVFYPPFEKFESLADEIRLIHDFSIDETNEYENEISIPKYKIYKPSKESLEFFKHTSLDADWAILPVEKAFPDFECPKKNRPKFVDISTDKLSSKTQVYSIGHGWGLPLKVSYNGTLENSKTNCFHCNLDFFPGNSGSPVFEEKSHKVIGLLIRGQRQFEEVNGKLIPKTHSKDYYGEECQGISPIQQVWDIHFKQ